MHNNYVFIICGILIHFIHIALNELMRIFLISHINDVLQWKLRILLINEGYNLLSHITSPVIICFPKYYNTPPFSKHFLSFCVFSRGLCCSDLFCAHCPIFILTIIFINISFFIQVFLELIYSELFSLC